MVIGGGDIASVLPDNKELLFFASGVSNSQCEDETEYEREINLLFAQPKDAHLVYFSTLSIFYYDTRYTWHKRIMENAIKNNWPNYCIMRIGNITWGKNPHILINYLKAHPEAPIRDEWRYMLDKDEFLHWVNLIPGFSCEMSITGKRMKVKEVVDEYVKK